MLRSSPRWLQALVVGQVVSAAGSLAWLYLTLYLVQERGLSAPRAGLLTGVYGACVITGNLLGGALGDRAGLRRALLGALGLWVVACASFPLAPLVLLGPVAATAGLAGGAQRPLLSALVVTGLPADRRREGVALSRAASNLGTVVGPPLGGLLAVVDFRAVFVLDAVTSLLLLGAVLHWCPRGTPHGTAATPGSLVAALRAEPGVVALLLSVLAVDTTYRLLYTVVPLLLSDRGAPPVTYGLTVTLNCVVVVLCEPRVARRLAHRSAPAVVATGYVVVGTGWCVLGLAPAVGTVFAAVLLITVGEMLYKPTATARAADLAPPGMEGRFQSLYAGASVGGLLLSPLLGTALYAASPRLVWPAAGVVCVLAAAGLLRADRSPALIPASR